MKRKRGQTYLDTLTDLEVKALAHTFCAIPQNLDRPGMRWMHPGDREAVTRAFKKIELERRRRRQAGIFMAGFNAGKTGYHTAGVPIKFENHELGSLEMMEWSRGFAAGTGEGNR